MLIRQEGIHTKFIGTLSLDAPPIVKTVVVPMLLLLFYLTATSLAPCPILIQHKNSMSPRLDHIPHSQAFSDKIALFFKKNLHPTLKI